MKYQELRNKQQEEMSRLLSEIRKLKESRVDELTGKYVKYRDDQGMVHYIKVIDAWRNPDVGEGFDLSIDGQELTMSGNQIHLSMVSRDVLESELEEMIFREVEAEVREKVKEILDKMS